MNGEQEMSKENKYVAEYRELAKKNNLKFIVEDSLLPKEPVIAIVNQQVENKPFEKFSTFKSLTLVSQKKFAKKHEFIWVDKLMTHDSKNAEKLQFFEKNAYKLILETYQCKKALLETDHGFATITLTPIKKDQPAILYEGEFLIQENIDRRGDSTYCDNSDPEATAEIRVRDCNLTLYYDTASKELVTADAKKYKGFGVFMQSLVTESQLKYYRFQDQYSDQVALANLRVSDKFLYPICCAAEDIPPLSLLGFSYGAEYLKNSKIPFVPFSKDNGCALPYEVNFYNITFLDSSKDQKQQYNITCDLSIEQVNNIMDKISKKGVAQFDTSYLTEVEKKQIQANVSQKITHFNLKIIHTPDILPMTKAANFSSIFFFPLPDLLTSGDHKSVVSALKKSLEIAQDAFERVEIISKKKSLDFKNSELSVWFQFLLEQSIYFSSFNKLLETVSRSIEDKTAPKAKTAAIIKKYGKEQFPSTQYPITFRNAAVNAQIADLWFLLKNNAAINYINSSGSSKKTALHVAAESKNDKLRLATCLLLLECKADPTLKDTNGKTALELSKNKELTFLYKRMQLDHTKPNKIIEKIKAEAVKQGFGADF